MIYILDTNTISDLIVNNSNVVQHIEQHIANHDGLALCQPVYYELVRGLIHRLEATLVTSDDDFDALPINCENWRLLSQEE